MLLYTLDDYAVNWKTATHYC